MMRILLTGTTGFLGRYVLKELKGKGLRALVLPNNPAIPQLQKSIEVVAGDLTSPASLPRALEGVTHVIHLAGYVKGGRGDVKDFMAINAEGTANLARTARASGVKHFIFTSSIAVYGHAEDVSEEGKLVPTPGYPLSKIAAEKTLRELIPAETTILRLPLVLGAGDTGFMCPALEGFRKAGRIVLIGSGQAPWSVLAASDAARAISLCLKNPGETRGKTYNVPGETTTNGELLCAIGRGAGCKKKIQLPYILAWLMAALAESMGRDGLTRMQVRALSRPMSFRGEGFRKLGFTAQMGWQEALKEGIDWCIKHKNAQ